MARKEDAGLIENHVEKFTLGIALVILLITGLHWGLESPRRVKLGINAREVAMPQEEYPPGEVDGALKIASDKLARRMEKLKPDVKPVINYDAILSSRYKKPYNADHVRPCIAYGPGREPLVPPTGPEDPEPTSLAVLLPLPRPEKPQVNACREVQVRVTEDRDVEHKEINISHGVTVIEYGKVLKKWKKALEKTYVPAKVVFVAVEVHRRTLLPDGSWSQSELVSPVILPKAPVIPIIPVADGKNFLEIQKNVDELSWISKQEYILEPPCYDIIWPNRQAGTWQIHDHKPRTRLSNRMDQPEEEAVSGTGGREREGSVARENAARIAAEKAKRAADAAKRAAERSRPRRDDMGGERGGGERGGGERGGGERGRIDPRIAERRAEARRRAMEDERGRDSRGRDDSRRLPTIVGPDAPKLVLIPTLQEQMDDPSGLLEVWFHDANIEEGATHSYRIRLVLVNPLLGRFKDVVKKDDAQIGLIRTPWSEWSDPVSVKRPTEFFLVGSAPQMGTVTLEVFTQRWGQRISHRFKVGCGEPIGKDEHKDLLRLGGVEQESTLVNFKTGAITVSYNFKKKQRIPGTDFSRTTTELLYLDENGKLCTRTQFSDKSSQRYKDLCNEVIHTTGTALGGG